MSRPERIQIESGAPGKRQELKDTIKEKSAKIGGFTVHAQDDGNELTVKRVDGGAVEKRLRLEFNPLIPSVSWQCFSPAESKGEIFFRVSKEATLYAVGGQVRMLNEIVTRLLMCLTGQLR